MIPFAFSVTYRGTPSCSVLSDSTTAQARVGLSQIPRVAISSASRWPSSIPCSIESTPAVMHRRAPPAFEACAQTRRPLRCASSIAAEISGAVIWTSDTASRGVAVPPVVMSFSQSAPARISIRAARRTPSSPSASTLSLAPWPPLTAIARPDRIRRGPATTPDSTASRRAKMPWWGKPQSRSVVMPAAQRVAEPAGDPEDVVRDTECLTRDVMAVPAKSGEVDVGVH